MKTIYVKKRESTELEPSNWDILKDIEFDENGVVIADNTARKKKKTLANYKFDENGVVVAI